MEAMTLPRQLLVTVDGGVNLANVRRAISMLKGVTKVKAQKVKAAIKREQSDACIDSAECERLRVGASAGMQARPKVKPAKAEPMEYEDESAKKHTVDDFAGAWATMDDDMLDAALAKFHKDWGGEGTAMEIAEELRGSRENSRTIETW